MSKTQQERYDEIKKEIWQISESYTLLEREKAGFDLSKEDISHINFLHFRLRELVMEVKTMRIMQDNIMLKIEIPLVYKSMINELMRKLGLLTSAEYRQELRTSEKYENGSLNILL